MISIGCDTASSIPSHVIWLYLKLAMCTRSKPASFRSSKLSREVLNHGHINTGTMMPSTMEDKTFIPAQIMPEAVSVSDALKAVKAGRANDVDIAAMILADNVDVAGSEEWTKAEDITLMRKVDWRLVPIVR